MSDWVLKACMNYTLILYHVLPFQRSTFISNRDAVGYLLERLERRYENYDIDNHVADDVILLEDKYDFE